MERGYIKSWRKIMDNPIYKRSTLYHLFNHCLLSANHKPQRFLYGGMVIQLNPGEFATTIDEISKKTGIPRTTVYDGLKTLSKLNLICQKPERKKTIISVVNWRTYQANPNESRTMAEQWPNDVSRKALSDKELRTKQECKNERNICSMQIEEIYSLYPRKADKNNTIKSIKKLLQSGVKKEELMRSVTNYIKHIDNKKIEKDYVIQSNNFFGRAARYQEFVEIQTEHQEIKSTPLERAINRARANGDI